MTNKKERKEKIFSTRVSEDLFEGINRLSTLTGLKRNEFTEKLLSVFLDHFELLIKYPDKEIFEMADNRVEELIKNKVLALEGKECKNAQVSEISLAIKFAALDELARYSKSVWEAQEEIYAEFDLEDKIEPYEPWFPFSTFAFLNAKKAQRKIDFEDLWMSIKDGENWENLMGFRLLAITLKKAFEKEGVEQIYEEWKKSYHEKEGKKVNRIVILKKDITWSSAGGVNLGIDVK